MSCRFLKDLINVWGKNSQFIDDEEQNDVKEERLDARFLTVIHRSNYTVHNYTTQFSLAQTSAVIAFQAKIFIMAPVNSMWIKYQQFQPIVHYCTLSRNISTFLTSQNYSCVFIKSQ
ncbi:hypothetical protein EGR_10982 [Echinococcus granulosus]|uniref:Uncharacterized protein n=1 Tax=Echinococcus granulosus TaxID=6210 RepID=W6U714_ECHGR|nr:hypothetical protein EGR_10982 [Echinococcus granulosus]EUB54157.1 hypothetical protein EGR_10982 [Echinococcus granulosus]